jgi:hypothetical protein
MRLAPKMSLFIVGLLAMTTTASAETPSGKNGSRQWTSQQQQWEAKRDLYRKLHDKWHKPKPKPIDPGPGNGQPLDPPPAIPQGPPGFVWVNGHWERVKAPHGGEVQAPSVVVRDHRKPAPHGVVIRDHRTKDAVVVRDHRTGRPGDGGQQQTTDVSSHSGGVTVSNSPQQRPSVQVRDHRKR